MVTLFYIKKEWDSLYFRCFLKIVNNKAEGIRGSVDKSAETQGKSALLFPRFYAIITKLEKWVNQGKRMWKRNI